jgi:polar amino acid transport system permease protein
MTGHDSLWILWITDWLFGFYNPRIVSQYASVFLDGLAVTLRVSAAALAIALTLGTLIAAVRSERPGAFARIGAGYVDIVRSTPLLVQLYVLYFALGPIPLLDRRLTALEAGILALGLNQAAYFSEIIRSGIGSVGRGQVEAARATGMSVVQNLRHVVLPQAVMRLLPMLIGQTAMLIKDSSIVSFVGVVELTGAGLRLMSERLRPNEGFLTAALGYLAIYAVANIVATLIERRFDGAATGERLWARF